MQYVNLFGEWEWVVVEPDWHDIFLDGNAKGPLPTKLVPVIEDKLNSYAGYHGVLFPEDTRKKHKAIIDEMKKRKESIEPHYVPIASKVRMQQFYFQFMPSDMYILRYILWIFH